MLCGDGNLQYGLPLGAGAGKFFSGDRQILKLSQNLQANPSHRHMAVNFHCQPHLTGLPLLCHSSPPGRRKSQMPEKITGLRRHSRRQQKLCGGQNHKRRIGVHAGHIAGEQNQKKIGGFSHFFPSPMDGFLT